MSKINLAVCVRTNPENIFKVLQDVNLYTVIMRDVKEIQVLENQQGKQTVFWRVDVDGVPVEWIEDRIVDEKSLDVSFQMTEGDFSSYCGRWMIQQTDGGSILVFDATLNWGLPNFEKYVGNVLEEKAVKSIKGMVFLIRKYINRNFAS